MGDVVELRPGRDSGKPRPLWRHLVGDVLREERLDQERILTEVAGAAGVSPQYLSEVERGLKEPSSEILSAVAGALGLGLLDLTTAVGERLGSSSGSSSSGSSSTGSRGASVVAPTNALLLAA